VRLYAGYAAFYKVEQGPELRDPVWRWLTAEDNYRARAFHDQISTRTVFLTCEMKI